MSMAITHFAVGGTLTTLVLLYLLPPTRYARSLVLLGGLWGMVPDGHWVSPVYTAELHGFHGSELANAFWLHRTLDVVDAGDSKLVGALALGVFAGATLLSDHWSYATHEQASDPSDSPLQAVRSLTVLGRLAGILGVVVGVVYLGLAAFHPAVPIGLYLGIGVILFVSGFLGGTSGLGVEDGVRDLLPPAVRFGLQGIVTVGVVTAGLGLLVAPIRSGVGATTVAYAGLGSAVLLLTLSFARAMETVPAADGRSDTLE